TRNVANRRGGRSLTGARIESLMPARSVTPRKVAPSRERGSKRIRIDLRARRARVAPSRERGSKPRCAAAVDCTKGRSLTGARIETRRTPATDRLRWSLPHGSADRNANRLRLAFAGRRRSLTGARIETSIE